MKTRKPKAGSKLAGLPLRQIDTIAAWMLEEGLSYKDTIARLQEVMGIHVSRDTISNFWERECVPRKLQRSSLAASAVQEIAASLGVDWQQANSQLIGQRIFEMLASPETDVKSVAVLSSILERRRTGDLHGETLTAKVKSERSRLAQKDRQMAFERDKFEFDAVEAALAHAPTIRTITADGKLSAEEKREQLRRLLFPQAFEASPT